MTLNFLWTTSEITINYIRMKQTGAIEYIAVVSGIVSVVLTQKIFGIPPGSSILSFTLPEFKELLVRLQSISIIQHEYLCCIYGVKKLLKKSM